MRPFEDLTRVGQVLRLKRLAAEALTHYDLPSPRLIPLQHWHNTTFRVETATGEKYILRIYRPGYQEVASIRSELYWLTAIRRDTDLVVPEPVPTREGAWMTAAQTPGVPEARHVAVFQWVEGRFRKRQIGASTLRCVGEFLASLHNYSAQFVPPDGFTRRRWDCEGLLGTSLGIDIPKSRAALTPEDRSLLDTAADRTRSIMRSLGEGPDVFGLIHADFMRSNYLFHHGRVHAIDFDDCGWGYYLYDVAVTLSNLRFQPAYSQLHTAFLQGYGALRPLPANHDILIDAMMAARQMAMVFWAAGHLDEPMFRERGPQMIAAQVSSLRGLLNR